MKQAFTTINQLKDHTRIYDQVWWSGKPNNVKVDSVNKDYQEVIKGHTVDLNLKTLTQLSKFEPRSYERLLEIGFIFVYQKLNVFIKGNKNSMKVELHNEATETIENFTVSNKGILNSKNLSPNKTATRLLVSLSAHMLNIKQD